MNRRIKRYLSRYMLMASVLPASLAVAADKSTAGTPACAGYDTSKPAATIDDHIISMNDLITKVMDGGASPTLTGMIDDYLVDRECERRGIKVPDAMIDNKIQLLVKVNGGVPIDQQLLQHHTTLAQLRDEIRMMQERVMLVVGDIQPTRIAHCQAILIRYKSEADSSNSSSPYPDRTADEALAIAKDLSGQIASGKDFADLARRYSEDPSNSSGGDIGLLRQGSPIAPEALKSIQDLKNGDWTKEPVKTDYGYYILKVVSTSDDHPEDENNAYDAEQEQYREEQARPLVPDEMNKLRSAAKIDRSIPD